MENSEQDAGAVKGSGNAARKPLLKEPRWCAEDGTYSRHLAGSTPAPGATVCDRLKPGRYEVQLIGPWFIETTHGIYPVGAWGFCRQALNRAAAVALLKSWVHRYDRAYNNATGEVIYRDGGLP